MDVRLSGPISVVFLLFLSKLCSGQSSGVSPPLPSSLTTVPDHTVLTEAEYDSSGSPNLSRPTPGCEVFFVDHEGSYLPPPREMNLSCACVHLLGGPVMCPSFNMTDTIFEKRVSAVKVNKESCEAKIQLKVNRREFRNVTHRTIIVKCQPNRQEIQMSFRITKSAYGGPCKVKSDCEVEDQVCEFSKCSCPEFKPYYDKATKLCTTNDPSVGSYLWLFILVGLVLVVFTILGILRFTINSVCCFRTLDRNRSQRPDCMSRYLSATPVAVPVYPRTLQPPIYPIGAQTNCNIATRHVPTTDNPPPYHRIMSHQDKEDRPPSYHTATSFPAVPAAAFSEQTTHVVIDELGGRPGLPPPGPSRAAFLR